ncbi:MAG: hypothetical protein AAFQ80_23210 [Cyanobacteria bacterium J06621_8]
MKSDYEPDFFKAAEGLKDFVKGIAKGSVYGIMDSLKDNKSVTEPVSTYDVFTYVQALEYAADKKLKYPNIQSTMLKLDPSPRGLVITQVFVDSAAEILPKGKGYLGRKVIAKELDEELKDTFGSEVSIVINLS